MTWSKEWTIENVEQNFKVIGVIEREDVAQLIADAKELRKMKTIQMVVSARGEREWTEEDAAACGCNYRGEPCERCWALGWKLGAPEQSGAALSPAGGGVVSDAARDVLAERSRQVTAEGWTPEHDDEHEWGELAGASWCYARHVNARSWVYPERPENYQCEPAPESWPLDAEWWKPSSPRRDLVKAGALILAEIERIDRLNAKPQAKCDCPKGVCQQWFLASDEVGEECRSVYPTGERND